MMDDEKSQNNVKIYIHKKYYTYPTLLHEDTILW